MTDTVPRDLVAAILGVSPDTLPPGDLPLARLAEHIVGYSADNASAEDPQPDHPQFWAMDLLMGLLVDHPDLGFDVIMATLAQAKTPEIVAMLAAGPLDDLITRHGAMLLPRIEQAATSARFRYALTGCWLDDAKPLLRARIDALRADTPTLDDGAPLPPA